jgi:uncharacterized protein YjbI with pentapeptide repeats
MADEKEKSWQEEFREKKSLLVKQAVRGVLNPVSNLPNSTYDSFMAEAAKAGLQAAASYVPEVASESAPKEQLSQTEAFLTRYSRFLVAFYRAVPKYEFVAELDRAQREKLLPDQKEEKSQLLFDLFFPELEHTFKEVSDHIFAMPLIFETEKERAEYEEKVLEWFDLNVTPSYDSKQFPAKVVGVRGGSQSNAELLSNWNDHLEMLCDGFELLVGIGSLAYLNPRNRRKVDIVLSRAASLGQRLIKDPDVFFGNDPNFKLRARIRQIAEKFVKVYGNINTTQEKKKNEHLTALFKQIHQYSVYKGDQSEELMSFLALRDARLLDLSGLKLFREKIGDNVILEGVPFVNSSLSNADFTGALLSGADFSYTLSREIYYLDEREGEQMRQEEEYDSHLNFSGAHLEGANFSNRNLEKVSFIGAHLQGANLTKIRISEVNFSDANLEGAQVSLRSGWMYSSSGNDQTVIVNEKTILPNGKPCGKKGTFKFNEIFN